MSFVRIAVALAALALLGADAAAAQAAARPQLPRTPHRTLNREDCLSCHAVGANEHVKPVPATEHNYTNATSLRCHRLAETMPPRSQHQFDAAHERCAVCHVAGNSVGAQPTPENHARRHISICTVCHEPQQQPD